MKYQKAKLLVNGSPWYPEFVPQITGGALPPLPVILKVSVKQLVTALYATPAPVTLPAVCNPKLAVRVEGPAITNVLKSNRS